MSDAVQIVTIICGCIISLATMIGVPLVTVLVWRIHQNAVVTSSHMNGIVTQLVKTTGESEKAKGVIQGVDQEKRAVADAAKEGKP
jgi:hypothetical protein